MKLEYITNLTADGAYPDAFPSELLRLFDFANVEAARLHFLIKNNLQTLGDTLDLDTLDFIEPLNCSLRLKVTTLDIGIRPVTDAKSFVCALTVNRFQDMSAMIVAFSGDDRVDGHNWLYDTEAEQIELLFSPGGTW